MTPGLFYWYVSTILNAMASPAPVENSSVPPYRYRRIARCSRIYPDRERRPPIKRALLRARDRKSPRQIRGVLSQSFLVVGEQFLLERHPKACYDHDVKEGIAEGSIPQPESEFGNAVGS